MKRMLDLFSGLKGASKAFINSEEWEVVTVDNVAALNPDLDMDVKELIHSEIFAEWVAFQLDTGKPYFQLIWASPPCVEFYKCLAPWFVEFYGERPSMDLVKISKYIIEVLRPETWVIENTKSGAYFMRDVLGNERQKLGPFYLWGNFPLLSIEIENDHKKQIDPGSTSELRSNIRAEIPYELSNELLQTLKWQSRLPL